jgi:hypothetical protein
MFGRLRTARTWKEVLGNVAVSSGPCESRGFQMPLKKKDERVDTALGKVRW